ncbi:MAG: gamma carbonic anhydrase family protein [Chloroflexi bacterium]|nr:gamma carbonic anhydrase family protein [Chloroflexota bacterium]
MNIHPSVFIADNATVIGDVTLSENASVWFGAVVRGDPGVIRIGAGTSVQDNVVIHADEDAPTTIGEHVIIGHSAVVHGATIGSDVLIGIGAMILNHARVGDHCILAAGTVVPEGKTIPPRSMVMGVPARVARELNDEDIARIERGWLEYVKKAEEYRSGAYKKLEVGC